MRVSALQLRCIRERPEETLSAAFDLLSQAKAQGAELACLPELWLPDDFALGRQGLLDELRKAAREDELHIVTGALAEKRDDGTEIVTHLISPEGKILGTQSKVHLFGRQREKYLPAKSLSAFNTGLGKIGMMVCYDNVFPEAARKLVLEGAEMLLIPSRIVKEGVDPWHLYLKVRALENRIPIVAPNAVEPPIFDGHSMIVDLDYDSQRDIVYPKVTEASTAEQIITMDVNLSLSKKLRESRLVERRPDLYR